MGRWIEQVRAAARARPLRFTSIVLVTLVLAAFALAYWDWPAGGVLPAG